MIEALQGRLIFGRTTRVRPLAPGAGARGRREAHRLRRPDGAVLEGWSSWPVEGPARGGLLYFGGRNENVAWAPDMATYNPGWAIHAFNYRGFGRSTGRPSERAAKDDARALFEFIAARQEVSCLAIAGRSLGTAIALSLAATLQPSALVLLSPFTSVPDVLRTRRLGRIGAPLLTQRFDCGDHAASRTRPTLVLLAEDDASIPHAQSRALCARLATPPMVRVIAGTTHRSLPRSAGAQQAIADFLAGAGADASPRGNAPAALPASLAAMG